MAAKKFYAVKKGKTTGVFETWAECKAAVEGYPGAEYRGFALLEEAKAYLGGTGAEAGAYAGDKAGDCAGTKARGSAGKKPGKNAGAKGTSKPDAFWDLPREGCLLAYVDGSYDDSLKKYAFGCVFLLPDGRIYAEYGNGDNEQSLQHRNVTGEMLGAMYAVKVAMINNYRRLEIRYDYQGIEKWVTGEWRSRTELTQKYAGAMREWGRSIGISFTKVAAHSNVYYNELADKMAKTGLTMGKGIPRVRRFEDMEELQGGAENQAE